MACSVDWLKCSHGLFLGPVHYNQLIQSSSRSWSNHCNVTHFHTTICNYNTSIQWERKFSNFNSWL